MVTLDIIPKISIIKNKIKILILHPPHPTSPKTRKNTDHPGTQFVEMSSLAEGLISQTYLTQLIGQTTLYGDKN